jgi:putative ABC transport system ATP-binding protein
MSTDNEMLQVEMLSKTYTSGSEEVRAVQEVSFNASAGEFLAIVGPSGSGKTTLIAMLGALLTPSKGSIQINNQRLEELSQKKRTHYRKKNVGYVFQANNLVPFLTAKENLLLISEIGGVKKKVARNRVDKLLEELGLSKRKNALATDLSGGERQRIAIGRALMNKPDLILVDEPTAALDSERGQQVVRSLIQEVKQRQVLGIMVTHDLAMAAQADRVLEMKDGFLV